MANEHNDTEFNLNGKSYTVDQMSEEQMNNLLTQINKSVENALNGLQIDLNKLAGDTLASQIKNRIPEIKTSSANGKINVQLDGETLLDLDLSNLLDK